MGTLITLDLPDDSPLLTLPWIISFGPLNEDEDWQPVVCGPYERGHAISLAQSVIEDEQLMAVVEPLQPYASVEEIRSEIESARAEAEEEAAEAEEEEAAEEAAQSGEEGAEGEVEITLEDEYAEDFYEDMETVSAPPPPSPEEVRAGIARVAARLTTVG